MSMNRFAVRYPPHVAITPDEPAAENLPPQLKQEGPQRATKSGLSISSAALDSSVRSSRASSLCSTDTLDSLLTDGLDCQMFSCLDERQLERQLQGEGGGLRVNITGWKDVAGFTDYECCVEHWGRAGHEGGKMQVISVVQRRYSEFRDLHRQVGRQLGVGFRIPRLTHALSATHAVKKTRAVRLGAYLNLMLESAHERDEPAPAALLTFLGIGHLTGTLSEAALSQAALLKERAAASQKAARRVEE